jgi:hypothetical protein
MRVHAIHSHEAFQCGNREWQDSFGAHPKVPDAHQALYARPIGHVSALHSAFDDEF